MPFTPSSVIEEDVGFLQLVVGGTDVTFFRDIPTPLPAWESAEPFDDSTVTITFPQLTPFEPHPAWLYKFAPVEINLVHMDGTVERLWEGMATAPGLHLDEETFHRDVECFGALYQLDLLTAKPPTVALALRDIGEAISNEFNSRPGLRTGLCNKPICGIRTLSQSSPNSKLLTGYIQDLLSKATISISPGRDALVVGIADCPTGSGYWLCATDGTVIAFGERTPFFGTMANQPLNSPISSMASDPQGRGYWLVAEDGGVFAFGEVFAGSEEPLSLGTGRVFIDIEATPSGNGYWLLDTDGEVYALGDAGYHGGSPAMSGHHAVGMARTISGNGYWILDDSGAIFSYGDAAFHGNGILTGKTFAAIESNKHTSGYWLLCNDGTVYGYGASTSLGAPLSAYNLPPVDIAATTTDAGYHVAALDGGVFSYGDAVFRGSVPGGGGVPHQWTLMKRAGRVPVIMVKDTWTEHWHVTVGQPGVTFDLKEDWTTMPNVIYGEGLDVNGCWWRNTKYPNAFNDTTPVWPGETDFYVVGDSGDNVQLWKQRMSDLNYQVDMSNDNISTYTERDRKACVKLQQDAGIAVTGKIGPQTWVATFHPGEDAGDLFGVHYAPLVIDKTVEQFTYAADGSATGSNPDWDPNVVRVERWEMFGANVRKDEGFRAAEAEIARAAFARLSGTMTLKSDPEEGSRYRMKAGQNIIIRSLEGEDLFFHIAQATVDAEGGTVELSVDMSARDLQTLQAVWERDRAAVLPSLISDPNSMMALTPNQQVMWDCDGGGGRIPRMAVEGELWTVIRIPAGQRGDIQQSILAADDPCNMSWAIFDRPITDAFLRGMGASPLDAGYWTDFPRDVGLTIAWGSADQPGGYWPGLGSADDPQTGVMVDQGVWHFESKQAPWMWVAIWTDSGTYVQGRIQPYFADLPTPDQIAAAPYGTGQGFGNS